MHTGISAIRAFPCCHTINKRKSPIYLYTEFFYTKKTSSHLIQELVYYYLSNQTDCFFKVNRYKLLNELLTVLDSDTLEVSVYTLTSEVVDRSINVSLLSNCVADASTTVCIESKTAKHDLRT